MATHLGGLHAAALQTLAALYQRDAKPTLADPIRFLNDAILAGHHQLIRYATDKALLDTPRTTVVACDELRSRCRYERSSMSAPSSP